MKASEYSEDDNSSLEPNDDKSENDESDLDEVPTNTQHNLNFESKSTA